MPAESPNDLKSTPLDGLHRELGARMVPFAGYAMPVQFPAGILAEHRHARERAGLFDVSHMGQVRLDGDDAVAALERLVPGDIAALKPGRMRYTQFTNEMGGIIDDLMASRFEHYLLLVINAACKATDFSHLAENLPRTVKAHLYEDRALLALQGPASEAVMERLIPNIKNLNFMSHETFSIGNDDILISRSGYTGEDGFEISCWSDAAEGLARRLLDEPEVAPIGLGARDSLRLEAGLCLYGHDIDETTTPVEANLAWSISKRRRQGGGFPGDDVVHEQFLNGPARRRVGLQPEGRQPIREGANIFSPDGRFVGTVTSGGFGPSVGRPVAMGYVEAGLAKTGTAVGLEVRGRTLPATVADMPFVPHRYRR